MTRIGYQRASRRRLVLRDDRNLKLDPITVDTVDGHTWDGLRLIPRGGHARRRRVAVIVVHGSVGNYITGVPRRVAHGLAVAGFTVLSVNTRMANYGVFFGGGLFHETPNDLDAWVDLARRMGHRDVVLLGFSMGASIVTHYQATRQRPEVVAVGSLAHPASLPASLERRWRRFGSIPDHAEVVETATRVIEDDPDGTSDEIFIVRRATGPSDEPGDAEIWTYRTWWFSRGPNADAAMSWRHVGALKVPLALIQAGADLIVPVSDGEDLERRALAGGVPGVFHRVVDGADHVFAGCIDDAVALLVEWLDGVVVPWVDQRRETGPPDDGASAAG